MTLAKSLQAEFVIQHRAGGHDATTDYVADFIARSMPLRLKDCSEDRLLWLVSKLAILSVRLDSRNDRSPISSEIHSLLTQVQADALTHSPNTQAQPPKVG